MKNVTNCGHALMCALYAHGKDGIKCTGIIGYNQRKEKYQGLPSKMGKDRNGIDCIPVANYSMNLYIADIQKEIFKKLQLIENKLEKTFK